MAMSLTVEQAKTAGEIAASIARINDVLSKIEYAQTNGYIVCRLSACDPNAATNIMDIISDPLDKTASDAALDTAMTTANAMLDALNAQLAAIG